MELTIEKKGPCEALVQLTVPADEFGERVHQGLQAAARNVRMKGFRPGKVPAQLLEQTYVEAVRREARTQFLQEAYQKAVQEHELRPAAHPRIDVDAVEHADGTPLTNEFQVWLRPDVELGDYKGLAIAGQPLDVEDEEVDRALADVRSQRATPEPAGEDGLPADGVAQCKVTFWSGEEEVFSREGLQVRPNAPLAGIDEDAFREALEGAQEGDTRELEFTFPDDFEREDLRGDEGRLQVEVGAVFRVVEPTDEELFQLFEVEDADGLRAKVREEITKVKSEQENQRIETALLDQVLEAHPLELPEPMVQEQAEGRTANMRKQFEEQGLTAEEVDEQLAGQEQASYEASARSLRAYFLIDEIAQAEDLAVQEEDVVGELHRIAQRNQASFDEVKKYYQEQNLFNQLAMELLERKVRVFLRENAEIEAAS